jgi:NAD(P) transhydrogenase subunit alpha
MIIGFCSSSDPKCPVISSVVPKYTKDGWSIWIQKELKEANAEVYENIEIKNREEILKNADIIYANNFSSLDELKSVKSGAIVISSFKPFENSSIVEQAKGLNCHIASMDMIPRTTLAQSMDILSSMASIAGYKAVLKASDLLPKYFPMLMTAAGTIKPSTVLILGAGVAGLQAIATAKRLGARVEVFDVRKAVKEEVQSLGATFVEVEGSADSASAGGYAIEQTEEYLRKQKAKIAEHVKKADVVITTAQLRGKKAPLLVTKDMVDSMTEGSVIIDLASSSGGNCELSKDNETICYNGITIMGNSALENTMIKDASFLLSNNIYNYVKTFVKEKEIHIDMDNEITRGSIINFK